MAGKCRCPECNHWISKVVQSNEQRDGRIVRRRHCVRCDHKWFTVQPPEVSVDRERVVYRDKMPTLRQVSAD